MKTNINIMSIGGYKGYGLGMLVEIFCGILADAAYGPNIRKWKTTDTIANLVRLVNLQNNDNVLLDRQWQYDIFYSTVSGTMFYCDQP